MEKVKKNTKIHRLIGATESVGYIWGYYLAGMDYSGLTGTGSLDYSDYLDYFGD